MFCHEAGVRHYRDPRLAGLSRRHVAYREPATAYGCRRRFGLAGELERLAAADHGYLT